MKNKTKIVIIEYRGLLKDKSLCSAVKAQGANEGIESDRKGASLKQCRQLQCACLGESMVKSAGL